MQTGKASPIQRVFFSTSAIGGFLAWFVQSQTALNQGFNLNMNDVFGVVSIEVMPLGTVLFLWIAVSGQLPSWLHKAKPGESSAAK